MENTKESIDLGEFVQDFLSWQKTIKNLAKENASIKLQYNIVQKQLQESQIAEKENSEKCLKLREMVNKLQNILEKRCNLEDENVQLKNQIAEAKEIALKLEESHKSQMDEALKNLEASQQAHGIEIRRIQENNQQQSKREVAMLEKGIQEKNGEIRELRQKWSDLERDKHTEIVKLRLEYDARLLKAQKSNSKQQTNPMATVNNEIFRKKLQFAKVQAEKEVVGLKTKINELERQLAQQKQQQQHSQLPQKRRRLSTMSHER